MGFSVTCKNSKGARGKEKLSDPFGQFHLRVDRLYLFIRGSVRQQALYAAKLGRSRAYDCFGYVLLKCSRIHQSEWRSYLSHTRIHRLLVSRDIVVTYNILHTIPVYIRETNMKRAVGRWKLGVGPCNS